MKTRKILSCLLLAGLLSGQASAVRGKANDKGWFTPGVNSIIRTFVLGVGGGIGLYVCKKNADECDVRLQDESLSKEELKEISESYGRYRLGMGVSGVVIGLGALNGILGIVDYCKSKKKKKKKFKKFKLRRCSKKDDDGEVREFGTDDEHNALGMDLGKGLGSIAIADPVFGRKPPEFVAAVDDLTPKQIRAVRIEAGKAYREFRVHLSECLDTVAEASDSAFKKLERNRKKGVSLQYDLAEDCPPFRPLRQRYAPDGSGKWGCVDKTEKELRDDGEEYEERLVAYSSKADERAQLRESGEKARDAFRRQFSPVERVSLNHESLIELMDLGVKRHIVRLCERAGRIVKGDESEGGDDVEVFGEFDDDFDDPMVEGGEAF